MFITPTYSSRGFVRSLSNDDILKAMLYFRHMPVGGRVLLSCVSFYSLNNSDKWVTSYHLIERESENHWVRFDQNDENSEVFWHADFTTIDDIPFEPHL